MSSYEDRVALIKRTYDAFNRKDIDALLSTLDPGVDWPNVLEGIRIHGHDAVRSYWEGQFREFDPQVEPTEFMPLSDRIIVWVHSVVRGPQGDLLSDAYVAHVYSFEGDLVTRMDVHPTVDDARRG